MKKEPTTLIIGAGGVGRVVTHKCVQNKDTFGRIILASRRVEKCKEIQNELPEGSIEIDTVDADETQNVIDIINKYDADIVINVALPYQDLTIMDACVVTKADYLDTANYEHPDLAKFEYKEQWARDDAFKEAGVMALLGSGFDPGATNVFCAYAQKHYFDEIHYIDILDCNAGDHGYPFATNFNPEINLREVSANGRYWEDGKKRKIYIYQVSDHEKCYAEVKSQAVSYTTGVPAMIGAKLMLEKKWYKPGVWNIEQFDPDPFMEEMNKQGLPWKIIEIE